MKRLLPLLAAAAQIVVCGAAEPPQCGLCHAKEAESIRNSPMTVALQKPADSPFLKDYPDLTVRIGKFTYAVKRDGARSIYSVTDGKDTLSAPIGWAFGKGIVGQSWLVERGGVLYEAAVSFYPAPKSLDLTPGHADLPRNTLEEAFGRKLDTVQAKLCFGCHTTDAVWKNGTHPESLTAGVQCWQCHAKAQQHATAMMSSTKAAKPQHLGAISPEDLGTVCSKCHPSWAQVSTKGPTGVSNVRMQFYRLTNSRCYDSSDARISCTACHDPHDNLSSDQAHYDSACRSCHFPEASALLKAPAGAKKCPVSTTNCISCHMPKVDVPGLHYQFTDHEIRVVRNNSYPD